jgi:hypothetical protein
MHRVTKPYALKGARDPCRTITPEDGAGLRCLSERARELRIRPMPTPVVMGSGSRTKTTPIVLSSLAVRRSLRCTVRRTCYPSTHTQRLACTHAQSDGYAKLHRLCLFQALFHSKEPVVVRCWLYPRSYQVDLDFACQFLAG